MCQWLSFHMLLVANRGWHNIPLKEIIINLLHGYLSQHNVSLEPYWLLFNNHSEYIHVHSLI